MAVGVSWPPFVDYILSVLFSHAANCCNYTVSVIDDEMNMEDQCNDNDSGKMKHLEKTCPIASLSIIYPTKIGPGLNPGWSQACN